MNIKIQIPKPKWESNLVSIILDLEQLRGKRFYGSIPYHIFFQLKNIFHILETLGSARIEGNNTTLSEYIEKIIEKDTIKSEKQKEIENIEDAIKFIEEQTDTTTQIDRAYICELHKIVTKELSPPPKGEGSNYIGKLRKINVKINKSNHTPPDYIVLQDYFEEFIRFINANYKKQNQLLMIAIAHHNFAYMHPFDNGNGRVGRLLNYAFLIKLGFQVKDGRIINPSSVFYTDREKYYNMLALADSQKDTDILQWSEYFLIGLKNEIEKIDNLLNKEYVKEKILEPVIKYAYNNESITEREQKILKYLITQKDISMKSTELNFLGITDSVQKSRIMKRLKEKNIIYPIKKDGRIYTIDLVNSHLLRWTIEILIKEGFVSDFLNKI